MFSHTVNTNALQVFFFAAFCNRSTCPITLATHPVCATVHDLGCRRRLCAALRRRRTVRRAAPLC